MSFPIQAPQLNMLGGFCVVRLATLTPVRRTFRPYGQYLTFSFNVLEYENHKVESV